MAGGGGEGGADGGGNAGFEASGAFASEADAVATIAENEPTDDAEAGGGDLGEIGIEEGGAVGGFEAEGGGGRRTEVPAVVEAKVQPHLEVRALSDAIRHMGKTMRKGE